LVAYLIARQASKKGIKQREIDGERDMVNVGQQERGVVDSREVQREKDDEGWVDWVGGLDTKKGLEPPTYGEVVGSRV